MTIVLAIVSICILMWENISCFSISRSSDVGTWRPSKSLGQNFSWTSVALLSEDDRTELEALLSAAVESWPLAGTALVRPTQLLALKSDYTGDPALTTDSPATGEGLADEVVAAGRGVKCFFLFLQPVPESSGRTEWVETKQDKSSPSCPLPHTFKNTHSPLHPKSIIYCDILLK